MKKTCLILFCLISYYFTFSQVSAWDSKAICESGGSVEIGEDGDKTLCYSWKATPADPSVVNLQDPVINVSPSQTTIYTRTTIGQNFSSISAKDVEVFIVNDVVFSEVATQKYGYDDYTDPLIPWKSVEKGKADPIHVTITPATGYEGVYFKVNSFLDLFKDVEVSPIHASSDKFDLNINGIDNGEDEVDANCEKEDGDKIKEFNAVSYNLKVKTVAIRVVHALNYNSTNINISDAQLLSDLNNIYYNQSVFKWVITRLPDTTVDFDTNRDGKIDVEGNFFSWISEEMRIVIDSSKDDAYDHNLFIVNNPNDGTLGVMGYNQRYGFIHPDVSTQHANTIAHELGHGGFGLEHPDQNGDNDLENLMHSDQPSPKKLRKNQWDKIH